MPYADAARAIIGRLAGDSFSNDDLAADIAAAYASFDDPRIAPLTEIGPKLYLLELFHGPTLAFKDIALQVLGRLFARALKKRGGRATVLAATSGDTGSAAIAALGGLENIEVFVLHPKGRVSEVQRRQMTTAPFANVHNIALEGSFDDAQAIVKALFAETGIRAARPSHGRQFDQLRAHRGAERLLFHGRGRARRAARFRRAHRQFRRCVCGRGGYAHGSLH